MSELGVRRFVGVRAQGFRFGLGFNLVLAGHVVQSFLRAWCDQHLGRRRRIQSSSSQRAAIHRRLSEFRISASRFDVLGSGLRLKIKAWVRLPFAGRSWAADADLHQKSKGSLHFPENIDHLLSYTIVYYTLPNYIMRYHISLFI